MTDSGKNHDPRRSAMLADLLGTLETQKRTRRTRRAITRAGCTACAVVLAVVAARWTFTASSHVGPRLSDTTHAHPEAPASPQPFVTFITTRNVARDVTIPDHATTLVQFIDDEQLLAELNQQRPCYGLVRTGTRVAVLDRCVR